MTPHSSETANADTPGTDGIWIFVFLDMAMFLLLFLTYLSEMHRIPEVFATAKHHLNDTIGLANTLLLLSSSWAMAGAVAGCRQRQADRTGICLLIAMTLGLLFCATKCWEYWGKIDAGINAATNVFFSFYYVITGIHFLHVLAGIGVMAVMYRKRHRCLSDNSYRRGLENTGTFWHFVDLVWLFIYPLLYLSGQSL